MFQIGTVKTSSYRSRMLKARSWSTKYCAKRPKVRPSCISLFVSLFFRINVGLLQMQWVKKTYCCLLSIWQSLHGAIVKNVSEMHIFQNGTPCQSVACFRMTHVSERRALNLDASNARGPQGRVHWTSIKFRQSGRSTRSAVDIFNTLRVFTKEPIREQEIKLDCMNIIQMTHFLCFNFGR